MRRALSLLALTLVAFLLGGCRGGTSTKPPLHPQLNMDNQDRYDAQEASDLAFLEDGRSSRPRVEGTVPALRVSGAEIPCVVESDDPHRCIGKVDDTWADAPPMDVTLAFLQRGQERFDIYCAPCHDVAGNGNGPVVERGMLKPPSFHDNRLRQMPVGQLYDIVRVGVRNMPGYGKQISVDDRWAIAAYVRALQLSQNASIEDVPGKVAKTKGWK